MKNEKAGYNSWFLEELIQLGSLTLGDIHASSDGFYAVTKSLSDILRVHGITTFPGDQEMVRECDKFFDDWFLYAVSQQEKTVYGLFKMREQEHDLERGIPADGDTPGVTISFISLDVEVLHRCLIAPTDVNRKALGVEINRVAAFRGQSHDEMLKQYFLRPEADGSYLIAELYVNLIASFSRNGCIPVPARYTSLYEKSLSSMAGNKTNRIPRFIDTNNAEAGYAVCDHKFIFIEDSEKLSFYEKRAILATHTANVSVHSFAAEVRFHAKFLTWYTKLSLPFIGRPVYDSAIRADMTIDDKEFEGPAPFYRLDSKWVKQQQKYHDDQGQRIV